MLKSPAYVCHHLHLPPEPIETGALQTRLAGASAGLLCALAEIGALLQAYTREIKALEERFKRKEAEWEKQLDLLEEQQEQLERGVGVRCGPHCPERTLMNKRRC